MIRVEAQTLEEAYSKAASELSCSVTELELNVIQYPKSGFLGFMKKTAIVEAYRIGEKKHKPSYEKHKKEFKSSENTSNEKPREEHNSKKNRNKNRRDKRHENKRDITKDETIKTTSHEVAPKKEEAKVIIKEEVVVKKSANVVVEKKNSTSSITDNFNIDDTFHKEKIDPKTIVDEAREDLRRLFSFSCYKLDKIDVSVYDDETLLIEFDGEDAALLIGKEGHRYKAMSYMIYNWINAKYGLGIRLEISQFLKNQEEMINSYLVSVIERINTQGRGQTKILDGVLIKIALEILREKFPEKYVGIKTGREGGRFIVVNDFNRKAQ
ncbi:MAG: Jag N-terminal domain-containing protein [Campylobacteraceae bacterium]